VNSYIQRKSDGKFLVDGRVVLNVWRDKALVYPDEKLPLARHTLANLGDAYEIVPEQAEVQP
jgi:hypothetical protein